MDPGYRLGKVYWAMHSRGWWCSGELVAPSSAGPGFKSLGCRITVWVDFGRVEIPCWLLGLICGLVRVIITHQYDLDGISNVIFTIPLHNFSLTGTNRWREPNQSLEDTQVMGSIIRQCCGIIHLLVSLLNWTLINSFENCKYLEGLSSRKLTNLGLNLDYKGCSKSLQGSFNVWEYYA